MPQKLCTDKTLREQRSSGESDGKNLNCFRFHFLSELRFMLGRRGYDRSTPVYDRLT